VLLVPRRPRSPALVLSPPLADTPILDVFVEGFVDAFAPDRCDDCGTSSAIRKAGSVRMFSPLLSQAFESVSIAHFGQATGSWRVMAQGYKSYQRTLDALQRALFDPEQSRSEGVLATVILLMAYEVLPHQPVP
jgi:hypothetical protein